MRLLNFNTWDKIRGVKHERPSMMNESEEEEREMRRPTQQYAPEGYTLKQLDELTENIQTKVRYAIGNIVRQQPFFSEGAIKLKYVYTYDVQTAATDGSHMFINPAFFEGMSKKAIEFIVLHEILHCMLLHFLRKQGRNHTLWNVATDFEINLICKEELNYDPLLDPHLHDPNTGEGILYNTDYRDMSAEEIYDTMPANVIKKASAPGTGNSKGGGKGKMGQGEGQGEVQGGQGEESGDITTIGEVLSPEEGERIARRAGVKSDAEINNKSAADWDKIFKDGANKRAAKAKGAGSTGAGGLLDRIISKRLSPVINWKSILKRYIGSISSNREVLRIPAKRWIPKGEFRSKERTGTDSLKNVVCAIDTSGSMTDFVQPLFSEIEHILKSEKVGSMYLLYFDTKVDFAEKLKTGQRPDPERVTGGGGTLFMPTIDWINQNAKDSELVIIMSDGDNYDTQELDQLLPKWRNKCIWIIVGSPWWKQPFGKVIHISAEQLMQNK